MLSPREDVTAFDDDPAWREVVLRVSETRLPTPHGVFRALGYEDVLARNQHLVLLMGDLGNGLPILARFHSECLTGDVFGSRRCDCGEQLDLAMQLIAQEQRGVIVYLRGHEGRGIGLHNKLRAYQLQDRGMDTVEANVSLGFPTDLRRYGPAAEILVDLGVRRVRMLTNNPEKVASLAPYGLECVERVPLVVQANPSNSAYLETKRTKMGHLIELRKQADS